MGKDKLPKPELVELEQRIDDIIYAFMDDRGTKDSLKRVGYEYPKQPKTAGGKLWSVADIPDNAENLPSEKYGDLMSKCANLRAYWRDVAARAEADLRRRKAARAAIAEVIDEALGVKGAHKTYLRIMQMDAEIADREEFFATVDASRSEASDAFNMLSRRVSIREENIGQGRRMENVRTGPPQRKKA